MGKKTAVVTGASGGIGSAVAITLARQGYSVMLAYNNNKEKAQNVCELLQKEGCTVAIYKADITNPDDVKNLFSQTKNSMGDVDVLVNCAGNAAQKLFQDITTDEWRQMMAVHADGTFYCCKEVLPQMIHKKSGCIVNISSMWGQVGASCEVHYSAAKAAVIGLSKALAQEVAPCGIRVNCVAPGAVETDMLKTFTKEEKEDICSQTPLGRLGTPQDVANTVAFLVSEKASFFTGQVLSPNGGYVL